MSRTPITARSFTADYLASLAHVDEDRELLSHHFGIPLDCVRKTTPEEDKTTLVCYVPLPRLVADLTSKAGG